MRRASALWGCGDASTVPNLAGDGAEGGCRRWGGSGFHRRRWRHGVLLAGVSEGGREVVKEFPRDDVVLSVCLAGAKKLYMGGSTARPSGGGVLSSPALRETMFGCGRTKLDGLGSTSGSRWCSNRSGSGLGGGVGG
jgi:hypothetical protein